MATVAETNVRLPYICMSCNHSRQCWIPALSLAVRSTSPGQGGDHWGSSRRAKTHCCCIPWGLQPLQAHSPAPGAWKLSSQDVFFSALWMLEELKINISLAWRCGRTKKRSTVWKKSLCYQSCWGMHQISFWEIQERWHGTLPSPLLFIIINAT